MMVPVLPLIGINVGIFEQYLLTYKTLNLVKIRSAALSTKEGKDMNDKPNRYNVLTSRCERDIE
jgi:hypothetical protein